jgi:hypothetical protein
MYQGSGGIPGGVVHFGGVPAWRRSRAIVARWLSVSRAMRRSLQPESSRPTVPNLDRSALLGVLAQELDVMLAELMGKVAQASPKCPSRKSASCAPSWTLRLRSSASAGSNRPIRT